METKFQGLPPLKRFRLMQQEQEQEDIGVTSLRLPAKKRKESRDPAAAIETATYCLPAKKRVWALQFNPNPSPSPSPSPTKPLSPFDLNVEYNPSLEEEREVEEDEEDEEVDDGIECAICQSTDGDPSDPIVFCDGCDLMVHTTCYGNPLIKGIPEGDWFCNQCLVSQYGEKDNSNIKAFSCCLCPVTGGAMKPTNDGRWAHVVCALLVPEVFFGDPEGRDGIDCTRVPSRRWEEVCYVCDNASGCAIDCSEPKCPLAFHVTCGLKEELCIEYREGKHKGAIVAGFCKNHTELWKKQQETGKFKIVAREDHKK